MTDFASDFAAAFLNPADELEVIDEHYDELPREAAITADPAKKAKGLRRGLIKAANLQDMLLEKYSSIQNHPLTAIALLTQRRLLPGYSIK